MPRRTPANRMPRTMGALKAWLRDTDDGRALIDGLTAGAFEERCRRCQGNARPLPKALVVLRRLGRHTGADVFADKGIAVRIEELIDTRDDPVIEALADELLWTQVPQSWRHLLWRTPRESGVFRGLSATDLLRTQERLAWLRAVKGMGK